MVVGEKPPTRPSTSSRENLSSMRRLHDGGPLESVNISLRRADQAAGGNQKFQPHAARAVLLTIFWISRHWQNVASGGFWMRTVNGYMSARY